MLVDIFIKLKKWFYREDVCVRDVCMLFVGGKSEICIILVLKIINYFVSMFIIRYVEFVCNYLNDVSIYVEFVDLVRKFRGRFEIL